MIEDPKKRTVGLWDWDGACIPDKASPSMNKTFTIGCFKWTLRSGSSRRLAGKNPERHLKKGRVQHRIKGLCESPNETVRRAKQWCDERNDREQRRQAKHAIARSTGHIGDS